MATPTTQQPQTGALASITGFFGDIIKQSLPVAKSYLDAKTAQEQARASSSASLANNIASGGYATGAVPVPAPAPQTVPMTKQPWFPFAVGGGVLLLVGGLFLAMRGRK